MKNDAMNNTASDISEIADNPSDNLRKTFTRLTRLEITIYWI